MEGSSLFTIIMPVFNKWELTRACLLSLREHSSFPFDLIVADNASSDDTATELEPLGRALFADHFRCLHFQENRNFGPACDAAAFESKTPLLFFLNNDTLATSGWEAPLLDALGEDANLGGVGPLLLYKDNTVQHLGIVFTTSNPLHLYKSFPATHPFVRKRRTFQALTAGALMMSRKLFMDHHGFYPGYCNGFEDVDLCLRIHATGKKFVCVPESVIYHLESQTPGRHEHETENSVLAAKRWHSLAQPDLHSHAVADGLVALVSDMLRVSLRLKDEDEAALAKKAGMDEASLRGLMAAHPYWVWGRQKLAEFLERQGKYEEALPLRAHLSAILESEQSFKELLLCAIWARSEFCRDYAEQALELILLHKGSLERTAQQVNIALKWAHKWGDASLARMYLHKFDEMFPGLNERKRKRTQAS